MLATMWASLRVRCRDVVNLAPQNRDQNVEVLQKTVEDL